jgi:hypothetical protein
MAASSGFYQSPGPPTLGNACGIIPAHRCSHQNGQQSWSIFLTSFCFLACCPGLGWEFQFLVPISGTPIETGILIPFLILDIPVRFFCSNCNVWKVRKLEFQFAKFGIPVICLHRNSLRLIVTNLY